MVFVVTGGTLFGLHKALAAETKMSLPGANASAVSLYITLTSPYKNWALWPGKGTMFKGAPPHGDFLTTYVNDIALTGIETKSGLQDGSLIVKENFDSQKRLVALTVMYKIKGYNPDAGDWYWAKYDASGMVQNAGRVRGCINCHAAVRNNDYLFSGKVTK